MKVHIVVRVYTNGASANSGVYSAKKRAVDYLERLIRSAKDDEWEVREWHDEFYGHTVKIIPPENPDHAQMFYLETREVL